MKINIEGIEGYADMTAEEKIQALENFEYEDNSAKIAELETKGSKDKKALDEALKKLGEMTKKQREMMTEDERAKADAEARDIELKELKDSLARRDAVDTLIENYGVYGMNRELAEQYHDSKDPQIMKNLMDAYAKKVKEDADNKVKDPNAGHDKGGADFYKPTRVTSNLIDLDALNKLCK